MVPRYVPPFFKVHPDNAVVLSTLVTLTWPRLLDPVYMRVSLVSRRHGPRCPWARHRADGLVRGSPWASLGGAGD